MERTVENVRRLANAGKTLREIVDVFGISTTAMRMWMVRRGLKTRYGRLKYSEQDLRHAVAVSKSVRQVLEKLGLRQAGGNHTYISGRIREFGINTDHFLGKRANGGSNHVGGSEKLSWSQVLVFDRRDGQREKLKVLRRAMKEYGFQYRCQECEGDGEWRGKSLVLQIDHIDGDFRNNIPENLRYLCPNCHSQTSGWSVTRQS